MSVHEAAARLRKLAENNSTIEAYGMEWASMEVGRDRNIVIAEYLSEHPADEGEPITEDWLRSVGFKHDDERPYHWINSTFTKFDLMAWDNGDWELADADNSIPLVPCINTRGAVRMLCRSLGIELKESH